MRIINKVFTIPKEALHSMSALNEHYKTDIAPSYPSHRPIRFVATETLSESSKCEIDFIEFETEEDTQYFTNKDSIFDINIRDYEDTSEFTAALLIPTGIGAELGGHCGDGNVAARLLASACDTLIVHPNVVNASDLNEMTDNTLYVEGGFLTEFFAGKVGLQRTRSNRMLMLMDKSDDSYFNDEIINAVSSARVTLGIDCDVIEMSDMIESNLNYTDSGRAAAEIENFERLLKKVAQHKEHYDAVGLATIVQIPEDASRDYFSTEEEVVNPWGGAEAIITHTIGSAFQLPTAHSPLSLSMGDLHIEYGMGVIDPRKAPESASVAYLHCILKGLHRSPRIVAPTQGLSVNRLSCLVIPDGCIGLPVLAALEQNIPVIAVKNKNCMKNDLSSLPFKPGQLHYAENYFECAGIMTALKAGVATDTLCRPINPTTVLERKT